jgi:hypothetical protein
MELFNQKELADVCRAHGIRRLSLFGSMLRGEDRPDSDVDLLVEFEPSQPIGYLGVVRAEAAISALLGRKVDLRTEAELSRYFREDVVRGARPVYDAA